VLSRDDHANAVVENLRAGRLDAREVILPPPAPLSEDDLPAWMRTTARPEPVGAAARPAKTFDEMTVGDLRGAVVDLHGELQRVRMERDGARHLADEAQRARAKQSLELAEARAEVVRLRADLERAGEMIARSIENRAAPLAWGSVEWKRETPDVLTLRLSDGTGERVARIPVEKGALVGAAAKMAKSEMRAEARDAKAGAR
jgi:hypothetical protein